MVAKRSAAPLCLVATFLCGAGAISACSSTPSNPGFNNQGGDNSSSGSGNNGNGSGNGNNGNGSGNGNNSNGSGNGNNSNGSGNGNSGNSSGNGNGGNGSGNGNGGNGSGNGNGGNNSSGNGSGSGSGANASSNSSGVNTSGNGSSGSSSGAGSSGSGAGSSSSSGAAASSSSSSGVAASSSGGASACAATVATGAIMLQQGGYFSVPPIPIGMGGYTFAFSDGLPMGSTSCVSTTAFCGMGTIGVANATYTIYGGGIGVNLNQVIATGAASPPILTLPATGAGIAYTLSSLPTLGARLIIDNAGKDYCAILTAASGTVDWASFNTACYSPATGVALAGPPTATHVEFEVPSGMTAGSFNFCVTSLKFM